MRAFTFFVAGAMLMLSGCGSSTTSDTSADVGDGGNSIEPTVETPVDPATTDPATTDPATPDPATPDPATPDPGDGSSNDGAASDPTTLPDIVSVLPTVAPSNTIETPSDASAESPGTERVVAEVGVGKKGRSLDEYEGVVVTPAKTLFSVRERVAFEIAIPKALQLYEAINGSAPKTHEEFMTGVVKANQIQLPALPEGSRYVYDPKTKQLMVERKR